MVESKFIRNIAAMKLLIKNIGQLWGVTAPESGPLKGSEMAAFPHIDQAWLAIEDGKFVDFGSMTDWPGISDWRDLQVMDAEGKFILPTWCDSHTHLVYASSRAGEFEDRIRGLTYQEIAAKGGGILNSAAKLAQMSEQQLFEDAMTRMDQLMALGTGAIEIKSGYGLDTENELKMLRVINRLRASHPMLVKSTFLGAHAYPAAYKSNPQAYLDVLIHEMIPEVGRQQLADFIDVFCEENYFSCDDTARLLEAGAKVGLKPKIHVNQFTISGGVRVGVEHGALTVDHLEVLDDADIVALQSGNTMPVALPGCSFFIGIPYTPARRLIEANLPVVLATDYNPGSCPSGNMNFVMALACTQMKMTPAEALAAGTINGAFAMQLEHLTGSITAGKQANFILTNPIQTLAEIPYYFGHHSIDSVYIRGVKMT
jgi:imidazolonepropionase